jgi:HEAT repeat protein
VNFEEYIEELADPARPLAVSKLVTLSSIGPAETALFATAWAEMELRRREQIVQELIDLAEDNVELNFDAAFRTALADRDPGVRRAAIKGLWEYERRDLIDPLLALLEHDPDAGVRADAALALGRYVLRAEFDGLPPGDAERVDRSLRRAVEDEAEPVEVRARALESLGARSQPWVRALIRGAFESADRRLMLSAVHAMGRSCDPEWLPAVFDELQSDDAEMRFEAAGAAGAIADEAALPHLLPLLHDEDTEVQEAAIAALGEIGGKQAADALQELLASGDERVREAALAAQAELDFAEDPLGFKVRD